MQHQQHGIVLHHTRHPHAQRRPDVPVRVAILAVVLLRVLIRQRGVGLGELDKLRGRLRVAWVLVRAHARRGPPAFVISRAVALSLTPRIANGTNGGSSLTAFRTTRTHPRTSRTPTATKATFSMRARLRRSAAAALADAAVVVQKEHGHDSVAAAAMREGGGAREEVRQG